MMKNQITLKELAKIAGTSFSTVSKALNDSDEISEATKQRIRQLAREHHYYPNQIARTLRSEKSPTIGVLIPDNANLYYAGLLKGVEDTAKARGYSLVIGNTNEKANLEHEQIKMMLGLRVAGILAAPINEGNYDSVGIPFVFLSRCRMNRGNKNYSYAINDDFRGAYMAAEHLIKQGKRNLFFITGPRDVSSVEQRTAGFQKAIEDYHLEFRPDNILTENTTIQQAYESMMSIMQKHEPPMGVFCLSDNLAIGALAAVRSKGYRIPDDVGLVGYDDIEMLKYLDYPLTTIRQEIYQIGAQGTKIMLNLLRKNPDSQLNNRLVFEPKLIVRNT